MYYIYNLGLNLKWTAWLLNTDQISCFFHLYYLVLKTGVLSCIGQVHQLFSRDSIKQLSRRLCIWSLNLSNIINYLKRFISTHNKSIFRPYSPSNWQVNSFLKLMMNLKCKILMQKLRLKLSRITYFSSK